MSVQVVLHVRCVALNIKRCSSLEDMTNHENGLGMLGCWPKKHGHTHLVKVPMPFFSLIYTFFSREGGEREEFPKTTLKAGKET